MSTRKSKHAALQIAGLVAVPLLLALALLGWLRATRTGPDAAPSPAHRNAVEPIPGASSGAVHAGTSNTSRETPESRLGASVPDPNKAPPNPLRAMLEAGLAGIAGENDPDRRRQLLDELAGRIRETETVTALAGLTDPTFERSGADLRARLIQRWAARDPQAAAAWIGLMSSGDLRASAHAELARGWMERDVEAAKTWALGLSDASDRDSALVSIAYELARSRPVDALTLAIELQPTERRDEVLNHAAMQWAAEKPREALEWASQVPDERLRTRLQRDIAIAWGEADPTAAATAAVQNLPPGREQNDAVVGIVQRWVQSAPEVAATWVAAFPEGELRETAGRELVTIWASEAQEAAGKWLNELEPGSFRDTAVEAYLGSVLPIAPDKAAAWVAEIREAKRQSEAAERVAAYWLEVDAPAAKAWMGKAPMSAEAKARLLAPH